MTVPKELVVRQGMRTTKVPYQSGNTILETLRSADIDLATQCEQGYCGTCAVQLIKGEIKMRVNDVLSEPDLNDGMRLACQGEPEGEDVEIELY